MDPRRTLDKRSWENGAVGGAGGSWERGGIKGWEGLNSKSCGGWIGKHKLWDWESDLFETDVSECGFYWYEGSEVLMGVGCWTKLVWNEKVEDPSHGLNVMLVRVKETHDLGANPQWTRRNEQPVCRRATGMRKRHSWMVSRAIFKEGTAMLSLFLQVHM